RHAGAQRRRRAGRGCGHRVFREIVHAKIAAQRSRRHGGVALRQAALEERREQLGDPRLPLLLQPLPPHQLVELLLLQRLARLLHRYATLGHLVRRRGQLAQRKLDRLRVVLRELSRLLHASPHRAGSRRHTAASSGRCLCGERANGPGRHAGATRQIHAACHRPRHARRQARRHVHAGKFGRQATASRRASRRLGLEQVRNGLPRLRADAGLCPDASAQCASAISLQSAARSGPETALVDAA
ncbi:MAG: hypothetical protein ACK55I_44150, partial [bacterium]